jgi:hypothetical protein
MPRKKADPHFVVFYNNLAEGIRKAALMLLPAMEKQEASIKEALGIVASMSDPSDAIAAVKHELYAMKDEIRKSKKTLRTLQRKVKATGAKLFDITKPEEKFFTHSLRVQRNLIRDIRNSGNRLAKKRDELKNFLLGLEKRASKDVARVRHDNRKSRRSKANA